MRVQNLVHGSDEDIRLAIAVSLILRYVYYLRRRITNGL